MIHLIDLSACFSIVTNPRIHVKTCPKKSYDLYLSEENVDMDTTADIRELHDMPTQDEVIGILSDLRMEANGIRKRGVELDEMISALENELIDPTTKMDPSIPIEDQAQICIQEGCSTKIVEEIIYDLRTMTNGSIQDTNMRLYLHQLISALNYRLREAGSSPLTNGAKYST